MLTRHHADLVGLTLWAWLTGVTVFVGVGMIMVIIKAIIMLISGV